MRITQNKPVLLLTLPLLILVLACTQYRSGENTDDLAAYSADLPLIYHMSFINLYTAKLYFSGEQENWKLADIYAHEIEEISELIIEGNYMKAGTDIGALFDTMLLPSIERLEEAIDDQNRDLFLDRYQMVIESCNSCHAVTDYSEVEVTIPETNPFNQNFSPADRP